MKSLKEALVYRSRVILPDASQCLKIVNGKATGCGYWDTKDPEVVARMAEAGRPLWQAACKCGVMARSNHQQSIQLWGDSNIPHRGPNEPARSLDGFSQRKGAEEAYAAAVSFADRVGGTRILTIQGDAGTGKTHLLEAIGRSWLHEKRTVRYEYVPDLLDELRGTYGDDAEKTVAQMVTWRNGMGLLILDDLGQGNSSEWTQEKLTALIDHRYRNGGWLVIAHNLNKDEAQEKLGFRLASRLWDNEGTVKRVLIDAPDYRREQ
jgi:DNA replication protein DnaC